LLADGRQTTVQFLLEIAHRVMGLLSTVVTRVTM